jgi:hypothetical protein
VTIALSEPTAALNRVDFPTFGLLQDRDPAALGEQPPGLVARRESRELGDCRGEGGLDALRNGLTDVVGEVDRGGEPGGRLEEPVADAARGVGERAARRLGAGGRGAGLRLDQILHRLGAQEVHLAGAEGAFGELRAAREPRAASNRRAQQPLHHRRAPVNGKSHVLARHRGRRGEVGDERRVDRRARSVDEGQQVRPTRRWRCGKARRLAAARIRRVSGPESRTRALAARPAGVAGATMVSSSASEGRIGAARPLSDS